MKRILAVVVLMWSVVAFAQAPAPPKVVTAAGATGGAYCDMIGVADGSVMVNGVEHDTGFAYGFAPAIPMADVNDNHAKWLKVLDVASKEQDKGGPYQVEVSEYRSCDGGGIVKITDGSILIKGMTLAGATRVADEGLKQMAAINARTKARAKDANSTNHDHSKAKKVKRNDLGVKVRD